MMDVKAEEESRGHRFRNMVEVSEMASTHWATLPPSQREYYERKALQAKNNMKGDDPTRKFTCLGVSYAEVDAEKREARESQELMVSTIKTTLNRLDNKTSLPIFRFFVAHVNYLYENDNEFNPCELGIAVFSLKDGLIDALHIPIKIEIAKGFRYLANQWAEQTHKIFFDEWEGESDLYVIYLRVVTFLKKYSKGEILPPLYTFKDAREMNYSLSATKSTLEQLCHAAGEPSNLFRVFSLSVLMFELKKKILGDDLSQAATSVLSEQLMAHELSLDRFCNIDGVCCNYHQESGVGPYCSYGLVRRWAFTICDHCCVPLGIQMISEKHVPKGSYVPLRTPKVEVKEEKEKPEDIEVDGGGWKQVATKSHRTHTVPRNDYRPAQMSQSEDELSQSSQHSQIRRPRNLEDDEMGGYSRKGAFPTLPVAPGMGRGKRLTGDPAPIWPVGRGRLPQQ